MKISKKQANKLKQGLKPVLQEIVTALSTGNIPPLTKKEEQLFDKICESYDKGRINGKV